MPSLAQLKQFQDLMGKIGREDEFRTENDLPPDNFTLPDREPAPPDSAPSPPPPPEPASPEPARPKPAPAAPKMTAPKRAEPDPAETKPAEPPPEPKAPPPEPAPKTPPPEPKTPPPPKPVAPPPPPEKPVAPPPEPADDAPDFDFNFEDFIAAKPDDGDAPPPPFDDESPLDVPAPDATSPQAPLVDEAPEGADDFNLDLDDLGFGGEIEPDAPVDDGAAPADGENAGFDDDFLSSIGEENTANPEGDISEAARQPFTTEDPDILAGLNLDASEEEINSLFPDKQATDEFPVADFSQPEAPDVPELPDIPDGGSPELPDLPDIPDVPAGDSFENFDLGGGSASAEDGLPDIDDLNLNLQKDGEPDTPAIEEINLSEEELETLLATMSSYPLNIRIACEETIAEQVIPPAQLSELVSLLISGGSAQEAAKLLSKIQKKTITVPKGYKTGEELEEEQASLKYIFIHKFLPFTRIALVVAAFAASVAYLSWQFIYKPIAADSLYKKGYELILSGEPNNYNIANQYFNDAFAIRRVKDWFYKYAERFRDERQYLHAEDKYETLLRFYPHDKKGALDYAAMETDYLRNYEKADRIVRRQILDYSIDDRDGLLALGDINLAWGEIDKSRYEDAREAYARLLAIYGFTYPVLERMMLYFIRTDNLFEVLPLQQYFMKDPKSKISGTSLSELGGYLLDKRFEVPTGVPDENIERIEGIKDVLLRAEKIDSTLPEPHYHLARYYEFYGDSINERVTLQAAARAFDNAKLETPKRARYRIDTQRKLASLMLESREFIPAENALVKGVNIYEDAVSRRVLTRASEFGRLYADLGDIEYFAKTGDMARAEQYYLDSEANGWMPPEIEYRLGAAYYRQEAYHEALQRFFSVSKAIPFNRRLLNTLAAASFANSDYFASEAYYKRLLDMLRRDRDRLPVVLPDNVPEHRVLLERMMIAGNNMGVTMNALAGRTGKPSYRTEALGMFSEAARISDALERDQKTLIRPGLSDPALPGASLPYLNIRNTLYPVSEEDTRMFSRIDADVLDPSEWEERMSLAYN